MSAKFDKTTTGTQVTDSFRDQIRGKHVLITGVGPQSLGEAAAVAIARSRPAVLILASRTASKLTAVAESARAFASGRTTVHTVVLDLASQSSIRRAANTIIGLTTHLDVLINNAGINLKHRRLTAEGIELNFATNHVGPFLLTSLLQPLLERGAQRSAVPGVTRIVTVSSSGHHISPMRFSDYNFSPGAVPAADERPRRWVPAYLLEETDGFPSNVAYGMSKCANILFTVGLRARLLSGGIASFAVDPGTIRTGLVRDISPMFMKELDTASEETWKSPDQGCATLLVAAFDPLLSDSEGIYLADCQLSRPASYSSDPTKAERLWKLSEDLTSQSADQSKL